ncbi:MAG: sigma-54 dependent transcriptional regulator [Planctomycetes bacterium]|nr:sigma-54 dependent transcriptional regulator [Planctomycetota bacterium]
MRDPALTEQLPQVCIVDDEPEVCASLSELFASENLACIATTSPEQAGEWILTRPELRLVITDIRMSGMNGLELLRAAGHMRPELDVIVMTGYPSVENAVAAMKLGAANFFPKPVDFQALLGEVKRILGAPPAAARDGGEIITANPRFLDILRQLDLAAATDVPVVILGESGTGKELLARRLHEKSQRRHGPYVCVNCAALPEALLESELFGHEKGAFTGAAAARRGRFEMADQGTLFLDEIGDMPLSIQAKILRAIEQGVFERVGGEGSIRSDLRFVAATNKNLEEGIANGQFRSDLYYRLSVVTLDLPPLRERPEDIRPLADHFIAMFNRMYGKQIAGLSAAAAEILQRHSWPGNIRELRNCLQRAVIFRDRDEISPEDLPDQYRAAAATGPQPDNAASGESRREKLRNLDRELIVRTLAECDGVKSVAADRLRIHRKTLYNRMKSLGLGD